MNSRPDRDETSPELGLRHAGPAADHAADLLRDCGLDCVRLGPPAHRSAALDWAGSGAMALTGPAQLPASGSTRPLAQAARAAGLALTALAPQTALARLDAPALLGERAALSGLTRRGRESAGGAARLLRARDDWLAVNLPRESDWSLVPAWLAAEQASSDRSFDLQPGDWSSLAKRLAECEGGAVLERARLMGLAVAPAPVDFEARRAWLVEEVSGRDRDSERVRPLRVLDLSNLWAGPLAASLLALAGAEVLKIENPDRPDGARLGPAEFFDLMNGGKEAWALDLNDDHDRSVFEGLLGEADVVIESARPRALAQMGIDARDWVGAGPGRVWASITGYGRAEPEAHWVAFGDDAAVAAGLAWPRDLRSQGPVFCGDAIADPITGLYTAVATLAYASRGRGALLDLSLRDVAARANQLELDEPELVVDVVEGVDRFEWQGESRPIAMPRARPLRSRALALKRASEHESIRFASGAAGSC